MYVALSHIFPFEMQARLQMLDGWRPGQTYTLGKFLFQETENPTMNCFKTRSGKTNGGSSVLMTLSHLTCIDIFRFFSHGHKMAAGTQRNRSPHNITQNRQNRSTIGALFLQKKRILPRNPIWLPMTSPWPWLGGLMLIFISIPGQEHSTVKAGWH